MVFSRFAAWPVRKENWSSSYKWNKLNVGTFLAFSIFCLLPSSVLSADGKVPWGYGPSDGPHTWKSRYVECGHDRQSPINVERTYSKNAMGYLTLTNYEDTLLEPILHNNGHTAQLEASTPTAKVTGGCLKNSYRFLQAHFHWGSTEKRGSEHLLFGKAYAMELHLVHQNDKYETLAEALEHDDGLAVLGVFFEVGAAENDNYASIVDTLSDIESSGLKEEIKTPLTLKSLLPANISTYMCYDGSLTTPPCSEAVMWTLLPSPVQINQDQMDAFRTLHFGNASSKHMQDNFRPPQEIHGRKVFLHSPSSTSNILPSFLLTVLLLTICGQTVPKLFS